MPISSWNLEVIGYAEINRINFIPILTQKIRVRVILLYLNKYGTSKSFLSILNGWTVMDRGAISLKRNDWWEIKE